MCEAGVDGSYTLSLTLLTQNHRETCLLRTYCVPSTEGPLGLALGDSGESPTFILSGVLLRGVTSATVDAYILGSHGKFWKDPL